VLPTNGVVAAVAIFLDFPAAGDAVSPHLLPGPFRVLNEIIPGALVSREGRAILYFGGTNWRPELFYLFAWMAGALAFVSIGAWWRRRRALVA
jgi:hypothetical protein